MSSLKDASTFNPSKTTLDSSLWLRRFSKVTCFATLFLIFAGGMVTSTGSGLSVPDWPLSYGSFFPPMVGGVFYEHGHRMIAGLVGFLMLCLASWLWVKEERRWLRNLGFFALGSVILQGLLGGLTVLLFLPPPVSVLHAVLAQSFFMMTCVITYGLSKEREEKRIELNSEFIDPTFLRWNLILIVLVYIQLIFGAIMRHTHSGLAIPDFPKMGDEWIPTFSQSMINRINVWRFEHDLPNVELGQIISHFLHRCLAILVTISVIFINIIGIRKYRQKGNILNTIFILDVFILFQLFLGISTVLSLKEPHITSLHVMTGAGLLGVSLLLFLRASPVSISTLKQKLLIL